LLVAVRAPDGSGLPRMKTTFAEIAVRDSGTKVDTSFERQPHRESGRVTSPFFAAGN
jgi:hypothetical protein